MSAIDTLNATIDEQARTHREDVQVIVALQERVEAQRKMLKRLEWNGYGFCEICGEYRTHIPDCELAALLKETT